MPFICAICTEAYTSNGTEHALCSTKCGHLFGKSCLERWIREKSKRSIFNCPVCCKSVRESDYHPIYDVPNELFKFTLSDIEDKCQNDDDIMTRHVLGTLKEKHFLIGEGIEEHIDLNHSSIEYFDVSNGHILIAGFVNIHCDSNSSNAISFLKIYEGDYICYNKDFGSADIRAVALNKFCEDSLEFCVGLDNGVIQDTILSFSNGARGTPHETILFNENKQINSICYLGHKNIVYSVGDRRVSNIFNIHTDLMHLKKNWLENVDVKLDTVTSLKVINDHTLFGIMDGKIYVFEEKRIPYEVYSDNNMRFIGFEYDSITNMILINALEHAKGNLIFGTSRLILRGIKKNYSYDTKGWRNEKYTSYSIGDFQDGGCNLPVVFKSSSIVTQRCRENYTYIFVPDRENRILRAYFVNRDGLTELLSEEKIEFLSVCIGIVALNKPQFFTSNMIKIPIVIIFEDEFMIYNFYTSIKRIESRRL
uniref:RING-type domain-containing protein n=1 Tax=Strongyloides venezuelensis TaxID=75913 RepID=A0A0K0FU64_STRVS